MNASGWYFNERDYEDFREQVLSESEKHAQACIDICKENGMPFKDSNDTVRRKLVSLEAR